MPMVIEAHEDISLSFLFELMFRIYHVSMYAGSFITSERFDAIGRRANFH